MKDDNLEVFKDINEFMEIAETNPNKTYELVIIVRNGIYTGSKVTCSKQSKKVIENKIK